MRVFSPTEAASAYNLITNVEPPIELTPGLEIEMWSLLCSVHPALLDILAACARTGGPSWEQARSEVERQQETRSALYQWLVHLDERLREDPSFRLPGPILPVALVVDLSGLRSRDSPARGAMEKILLQGRRARLWQQPIHAHNG
jgi:hypothetical protein